MAKKMTPPMSMRHAFIKDIGDDPDNDTPRLVYADWLEENGDSPRAELIRVQCKLADIKRHWPYCFSALPPSLGMSESRKREHQLLKRHGNEWLGKQAELGYDLDLGDIMYSDKSVFRRGFPDFILASDFKEFKRAAPALFDAESASLRGVGFTHLDDWSPVAKWRHLSRLSELRLEPDEEHPSGLERLAHSPFASNLSVLRLQDYYGSKEPASALSSSPLFAQLKELYLYQCNCCDWSELAASGKPVPLERLYLIHNCITSSWIRTLAGSACFSNLRFLYLNLNKIGANGAKALADSPYLGRLTSLGLDGNKIRCEGVAALANSPNLSGLISLNLASTRVGTRGVEALAASPYLSNLRMLDLSDNRDIGVPGVRALLDSQLPERLHLSLASCRLSSPKAAKVMEALKDRMGDRLIYTDRRD